MEWLPIAIAVVVLLLILTNIRVVPQGSQFVIERLGRYRSTCSPAFHVER